MSFQAYWFNPSPGILAAEGRGVRIPRMGTVERLSLALGASDAGTLVHDLDAGRIQVWDGVAWATWGTSFSGVSSMRTGRGSMADGVLVVQDPLVTAASKIFPTHAVVSGPHGWLHVSARVPGTSFTVTSSNGSDTSTIDWLIIEP